MEMMLHVTGAEVSLSFEADTVNAAHFLNGDSDFVFILHMIYWSCRNGYIICLHNTLSVNYVHSQPHLT